MTFVSCNRFYFKKAFQRSIYHNKCLPDDSFMPAPSRKIENTNVLKDTCNPLESTMGSCVRKLCEKEMINDQH